uniref:TLC domain-containing protein n=1 Tax=Skeletonema marinoi TaxID=267567 RepID=A0A7S2KRI4_9STRA
MCRPSQNPIKPPLRLLLTQESFNATLPAKDDSNKLLQLSPYRYGLGGPDSISTMLTVSIKVLLLFTLEHIVRLIIQKFSHVDPILHVERNRHILARHLAVDFGSLAVCGFIAVKNRHTVCGELITHMKSWGKSDSMSDEETERRVFTYHPASQQMMVWFFAYQVKNMYDTIYWNDGIEFVIHHIFAGAAAWGGMFPGCCHFYALFYFGFSELSTAILCLLANFDDQFGVVGLEKVFPKTKIVLGALFVTSFIVCRCIMWPFVTHHFFKDTKKALASTHPLAASRRNFLHLLRFCCFGLSLIQFFFVAMIIQTGKEELAKLMS